MRGNEIPAMDPDSEVEHDFRPFLLQFKSGRVVRFDTADTLPASADPAATGVSSKDVVINPTSGLWARHYLPPPPPPLLPAKAKLPVVVYFHGGAFVVGSTAHRPTHMYLNRLAADANVLVVSPEYRLAPEHPLPAAHDDSWEALNWVASHATTTPEEPTEPWVAEHGDLSRVFLLGVSAGGNIAHHMAARAGGGLGGVHVRAMLLVHPYFNGESVFGNAPAKVRAMSEALWRFVCPGTPGLDDPLCNPFAGGGAVRVDAGRVLVCVAEKDVLRDRGVWYFERLKGSGYTGEVELLESEGQGHVFHYRDPECEQARVLHARVLSFLRDD